MNPIFLLTDFGYLDPFVGIMRAVICSENPSIPIHDITHGISPQNILAGAIVLEDSLPWLPHRCVVCCVVDPGVGSARKSLVLQLGDRLFVGPDNGLLSTLPTLLPQVPARFFPLIPQNPLPSTTFHGRDLYAPIAARLALGELQELFQLPEIIPVSLQIPQARFISEQQFELQVLIFDQFGNATLNLRSNESSLVPFLADQTDWILEVESGNKPLKIQGLSGTYSQAAKGNPLFYWNSAGRLEVAVNQGNARVELGLNQGTVFKLQLKP